MNTTTSLPNMTTTSDVPFSTDNNQVSKTINVVTSQVNKSLKLVSENPLLSAIVGMILVLYSAKAAPELPRTLQKYFDYPIFKVVFMFLLAYFYSKDPSVALITAIVLYLSIQFLVYYEIARDKKCKNKKNKNFLPEEVKLNETQAQVLNALLEDAKVKNDNLKQVENFSNTNVNDLNKCRIEAFTADAIVEAAVNSIQNQQAALTATKEGDMDAAQQHIEEVKKSNDELTTLLASNLTNVPTADQIINSVLSSINTQSGNNLAVTGTQQTVSTSDGTISMNNIQVTPSTQPLFSEIGNPVSMTVVAPSTNMMAELAPSTNMMAELASTNMIAELAPTNMMAELAPSTNMMAELAPSTNMMVNEVSPTVVEEPSILNKLTAVLGLTTSPSEQAVESKPVSNVTSEQQQQQQQVVVIPTPLDNGLFASVEGNNALLDNCIPKVQTVDMCAMSKSDVSGYDTLPFAPVQ
jgi:hypothetical protein